MITPRSPSASAASVFAMAAAAIRIRLNVPIRLTSMTLRKIARSCGVPSRPTVRAAQPIPAQFTATRSGGPSATAASTAAWTGPSFTTSVRMKRPPMAVASAVPRCSLRSATSTAAPAAASSRAVASPRPLAPPETIAAVPFSFMGGAYLGGSPAGRTGLGRAFCQYPGLASGNAQAGPPTAFDWRWIFFVNLPVGVLVLLITPVVIPDLRLGRRHRIDIPGVLLASAALLAICYGLVEAIRGRRRSAEPVPAAEAEAVAAQQAAT